MRRFHSLVSLVLLAPLGLPLVTGGLGEEGVGPGLDGPAGSPEARPSAAPNEPDIPAGLSPHDWAGIRAAHEVERYSVREVDGELQARNPGQRWTTRFDGRGFLVEPDAGGWEWGLELASYGFVGHEVTLTKPEKVNAEGGRVAYAWDDTIEEWYINDGRGLEHGYTMARRPESGGDNDEDEPLTITLAVRGDLSSVVEVDGHGVHFVNSAGSKTVTYTGLKVVDADGRMLPATFRAARSALVLSIDDDDAHYPITIDPVAQQAYLKASNADAYDWFGYAVSMSGNTVVIGSPQEDSSASGVNGDQYNNGLHDSGAAYVFVRVGTTWSQQAYLKASNPDADDWFGHSVSISGDTMIVGAIGESSAATGVNGDQGNSGYHYQSGAAYVFVRSGRDWHQQAYLKASNTDRLDLFGITVSNSGDTAVVGASRESSGATGVNGDQDNNDANESGAAYVFVRNGTNWSQQAYLKASNTDEYDSFGYVSISGDTIVVGAPQEDSSSSGINGDQNDNGSPVSGAAYVFARSGTTWAQQAYLKASNPDASDYFGVVSLFDDTLVVGAVGEDSNATGVNGDQNNNSQPDSGAAYVFVRNGTTWSQQAYLKASNAWNADWFGYAVSVFGDMAIVGARFEDSGATGFNGDQGDNSSYSAGAAYAFVRNNANWSQQLYVKASNTGGGDAFGGSLAISGDGLVVGAYGEDSAATGVNGDQDDNSSSAAGAAYVFEFGPPGAGFCFGDPGSGGSCPCNNSNDGSVPGSGCANGVYASGAQLLGSGFACVSNDTLVLHTEHQEPNNSGLYFQGTTDLSPGLLWGDGLRCTGGGITRLQVRFADAAGSSSTTLLLAAKGGASAGDTRFYQCWYRNPLNSPCGAQFNTTNGYSVTWIP